MTDEIKTPEYFAFILSPNPAKKTLGGFAGSKMCSTKEEASAWAEGQCRNGADKVYLARVIGHYKQPKAPVEFTPNPSLYSDDKDEIPAKTQAFEPVTFILEPAQSERPFVDDVHREPPDYFQL